MDENYDLKISGPIKTLTEYPQYLIEEFLNDNKEGAVISCTSIKQIQITCSELSLKTYRQEWNKDFSFDWDSGEKIVNDELKAKVESLSYERLLGEGIFHDEAIGLFGEKNLFQKQTLSLHILKKIKVSISLQSIVTEKVVPFLLNLDVKKKLILIYWNYLKVKTLRNFQFFLI